MGRALGFSSRWLPKGWLDVVRQLVLCAIAYEAYQLVRGVSTAHVTVAFAHARDIVGLERSMGLFFEPQLQHLVIGHGWLVDISNWLYANSQLSITPAFLVWLYFQRNESFYFVRNMFIVSLGLALIGYSVFPTAPPRLMPEWGFTDTVANVLGPSGSSTASLFYNPYAAVPSMHVAFALMVAVPAVRLVTHRTVKAFWCAYPVIITIVVMVTANHFWLDAAFGVLVAALAAYTAHATLGRARPEAWSWRTALGAKATA